MLSTKDHLVTRGIISQNFQLCVIGCGVSKTIHHGFLSCPTLVSLWGLVRLRVGVVFIDQDQLQDHFIHSSGGLRARRSFTQLIWLCCVWILWTERNNRLFKNKENFIHQLLDKVKLHSYWWVKTYNADIDLNFHMQWSNSFVCMGTS